jgi:hypothetical protein
MKAYKINCCVFNTECTIDGDVWATSIFDMYCTILFNYYGRICIDVFVNRN